MLAACVPINKITIYFLPPVAQFFLQPGWQLRPHVISPPPPVSAVFQRQPQFLQKQIGGIDNVATILLLPHSGHTEVTIPAVPKIEIISSLDNSCFSNLMMSSISIPFNCLTCLKDIDSFYKNKRFQRKYVKSNSFSSSASTYTTPIGVL